MLLVEPLAQVDEAAAFAAEGEERGVFAAAAHHGLAAGGTLHGQLFGAHRPATPHRHGPPRPSVGAAGAAGTARAAGLLGTRRALGRLAGAGGRGGAALVVGDVETAALEDDAGAGADQALEGTLLALGADLQGIVGHALEGFEFVVALLAAVVIGRHGESPSGSRKCRRPQW